MKKEQINIRDPFVLCENGKYYLYGTRAKDFGVCTKGFDVYISEDLENWSEPLECFNSEKYGLNREVNWAPEVHKYNGKYYMFATFTQGNGLRGTYSLRSDSLLGPFEPCSEGALTPQEWECLDGTLYVDKAGAPYLVFCHEHTQITDGTICYARLNEDLSAFAGDVVTMFSASSCGWATPIGKEKHYVTDGPFMYRSKTGELFMIWSTFVKGKYAECLVKFKNGKLGLEFEHLKPLLDSDGGHGMIFCGGEKTYFTYHTPNQPGFERHEFCLLEDCGDIINIKNFQKEKTMNLSVCGIDCSKCKFFADKKCSGCRNVAPEGKCIWNGRCDLYDCCAKQNFEHCGKCEKFPCDMLKEWASGENPERIQNLMDLVNNT